MIPSKALRSQITETGFSNKTPRSRSTDFVGSSDLWKCGKPKIKPTTRPIVRFPQLCAIAKDQFQPDGGWKDAIMWRCARLGFASPDPEQVRKAMEAVDHVHKLSSLLKPKPERMAITHEPRPFSKTEAASVLAEIFRRLA